MDDESDLWLALRRKRGQGVSWGQSGVRARKEKIDVQTNFGFSLICFSSVPSHSGLEDDIVERERVSGRKKFSLDTREGGKRER